MRSLVIWFIGLVGLIIAGVAAWSSWSTSAVPVRQAVPTISVNDEPELPNELRDIAREYMADAPELRSSVEKLASALGGDAIAADMAEQRRKVAVDIASARNDEQTLRQRLAQLTDENARLERITSTQRQVVSNIINEWLVAQDRAKRYADVKGFSLSVIANWVSGPLLVLIAWMLGRRSSSEHSEIRPLRRA